MYAIYSIYFNFVVKWVLAQFALHFLCEVMDLLAIKSRIEHVFLEVKLHALIIVSSKYAFTDIWGIISTFFNFFNVGLHKALANISSTWGGFNS